MIADLKERETNTVIPFVIVNFSNHEHLHLLKDHVMAFPEKYCNEGEVLEICTMEQLEKELPRNCIPERKRQEKFSEFFENPFMQKDDDFLKSHIQYLGHLISADGIQPLPEKLKSIAKMPAPRNPKEVKQFLRLVGSTGNSFQGS